MTINFSNLNIDKLKFQTEFEKKIIVFLNDWFSDCKTIQVQTSGSTGTPKIFEVEKQKMRNSAKMTCDFFGLKEGNSALLCLPVDYISGKMILVRAIERKLKLKIVEPSIKPLVELNSEIDFCAMTPLQVENSLDKLHLIKYLIIGGAEVSENLKHKIFQQLHNSISQTNVYETYGMSETLSHIALRKVFPTSESFFKTLDHIQLSLDDRDCLTIFAPKMNTDLIKTNDLVELKNEKEFRFLGRIDNVINTGGVKIFPEELESFVKKNIQNELIFAGINDEILGQKLVLIIEGKQDENLKFKIRNLKFEKKYHQPKKIIFLEKLPRTENGKILRNDILKLIK